MTVDDSGILVDDVTDTAVDSMAFVVANTVTEVDSSKSADDVAVVAKEAMETVVA